MRLSNWTQVLALEPHCTSGSLLCCSVRYCPLFFRLFTVSPQSTKGRYIVQVATDTHFHWSRAACENVRFRLIRVLIALTSAHHAGVALNHGDGLG